MQFIHDPVMLDQCVDALNIDANPNGVYADCTAGGGGHSLAIARKLGSNGRLIAIDRDSDAIEAVRFRLSEYSDKLTLVKDNFQNAAAIFKDISLDGAMLDLGVSSYQLDTPERGFSYSNDAHLDMRMDTESGFSAYDIVNGYTESQLTNILYKWGEERFAPRISYFIAQRRMEKPIETTFELVDIIRAAIPASARENGGHPAKRTFQALRIEVNHELDAIEPALRSLVDALKCGGRAAVITFHSLEDRIVKQTFAALAKGCVCPPDFPVCVCGIKPTISLISRKPILPDSAELEHNPRSHSAKLRIAQKL